ncbi:MAG: MBL fold metallo-hydrolase [Bryobacteraceae bacterium]|jgi:glyoxylase-like metal-dependent hydrolase (beta-lactamase superfamily II)
MHSHTRRGFFARLSAGWMGLSVLEHAFFSAAQARAQAAAAPAGLFEIEKVAEGVWAAIARPAAMINCNAAVFENANDLLVIDTHSKPSAAAALIADLRKITPKPVRYVVNTHFHFDHVGGNSAYAKVAPGADFISSTATRDLILKRSEAAMKSMAERLSKEIERFEQQRAAAKDPRARAHFEQGVAEAKAFLAELRGMPIELPNITFDRDLVIHDKAHELRLSFRGRGHTAGDVIVWCPQKKVLASGDLLHGFLPYVGDGYPREWPATLRSIAELDFRHVIGGHGAVQDTRERLPQMAAYISELTEAVSRGKERGRTVEQLQKEITPPTLKSLAGTYGEYVAAQSVRYSFDAALSTPAEALAEGVKENIAATFSALENK